MRSPRAGAATVGAAWHRLGLRRFAPSGLGWMLLALFVYYLFAGLFSELVLQPEQEDISSDLGVGDENRRRSPLWC